MGEIWNAHVYLCNTCRGDKGMRRVWYRRFERANGPALDDRLPCPTCNGRGFKIAVVKDEQEWLKRAKEETE